MADKEYAHPPPPPPEQRHPLSNLVRDFALSLPNTREDHPWGDIVFKVGDKMFVTTNAHSGGVCVKANPAELESLLKLPNIALAPYVGRFGWITVSFDDASQFPFVQDLIRASYELIGSRSSGKRAKKSAR